MTDAATIPSRADMDRAAIEKTAADATAQLAQMARDFKSSPSSRVEQPLAQLEALEADLHFLNRELVGSHAAQSHRSALQSQLAVAEAEAATEIREAFSEAQRVENAMNGVVDHVDIETTIDGQIPARDFAGALQSDLELDIHPDLVRNFHITGKSGDPTGHVAAQFWLDMFNNDAEMQRKLAAGDLTMRRRFREAHMYLAGKCGDVSPAEEAALRAQFSKGDN